MRKKPRSSSEAFDGTAHTASVSEESLFSADEGEAQLKPSNALDGQVREDSDIGKG